MILNDTVLLETAIRRAMEEAEPSKFKRVYARRVAKYATRIYALLIFERSNK